jgi:hypothetical protein
MSETALRKGQRVWLVGMDRTGLYERPDQLLLTL